MTKMRLATNAVWRDAEGNRHEEAEYHLIVCFGRLAEIAAAYCTKGRRIFVEGKLRTRDYDAADGTHRWTTEVVADSLQLLDRRDGTERDRDTEEEQAAAAAPVLTAVS